jgi:hypothetical protein
MHSRMNVKFGILSFSISQLFWCTIQHHHPGYSQSIIQVITMLDITVLDVA